MIDKLKQMQLRRQRVHGYLLAIEISKSEFVLAKILNDFITVVYRQVFDNIELVKANMFTQPREPLLYSELSHSSLKSGLVHHLGKEIVTEDEISTIPLVFKMETGHPEQCTIVNLGTGETRSASPSECVGLNYLMVWEARGLAQLIDDKLRGRMNRYYDNIYKQLEVGIQIEKSQKIR